MKGFFSYFNSFLFIDVFNLAFYIKIWWRRAGHHEVLPMRGTNSLRNVPLVRPLPGQRRHSRQKILGQFHQKIYFQPCKGFEICLCLPFLCLVPKLRSQLNAFHFQMMMYCYGKGRVHKWQNRIERHWYDCEQLERPFAPNETKHYEPVGGD